MKPFILSQVIWFGVMSALAAAIHYQSAGLANVAALAMWALALLALFVAAMVLLGSVAVELADGGEKRDKGIAALRKLVNDLDKRSNVRRAWSWLQSIALLAAAAYAGLFVTAVVYAITIGVIQFSLMVARSTLQKLDAAAA